MRDKESIKRVEGWVNNIQPSCSFVRWELGEAQAHTATCTSPKNKGHKCRYKYCPKVNNNG